MRISLRLLKQKLNLVIVVAAGVAAGGITTAVVMAAEPDTNGQINACYDNTTQVLSANQAGGSCPAGSSALNWQSGNPVVRDHDGQVVGKLVQYNTETSQMQVYNYGLHRLIDINVLNGAYDFGGSDQYPPYFASSDCTVPAYIYDGSGLAAHARLFETGNSSYGVVPDNTDAQSFTFSSLLTYDPGSETTNCIDVGETDGASFFYPLTPVSLPFTTPLALPLSL
jgi:hypothetical protein